MLTLKPDQTRAVIVTTLDAYGQNDVHDLTFQSDNPAIFTVTKTGPNTADLAAGHDQATARLIVSDEGGANVLTEDIRVDDNVIASATITFV